MVVAVSDPGFFFAAFCFFFQSYLVVIRSMISDMIYSNI